MQSMTNMGFLPASDVVQPRTRIQMSVNGAQGTGKTRFALTAPRPIALFNFDRPLEDYVISSLGIDKRSELFVYTVDINAGHPQDIAAKKYSDFFSAYENVLKSSDVATVVLDTFCSVHEAFRLKLFGRLQGVKPHHYAPVNLEMQKLLKMAEVSDKNVIFNHRLKKQFVRDSKGEGVWNGEYEPKGWSGNQYEVPVVVDLRKDHGECCAKITKSGIDFKAENEELEGAEIDFSTVASMVTDTPVTDWM